MTHRPNILTTLPRALPAIANRRTYLRRLLAPFAIAAMLLGLAGNANAQTLSFGIDPGIDDQVYTVGQAVNVTLLNATGGTAPLRYDLTATDGSVQPPPIGLVINSANRTLIGNPTFAAEAMTYRWTVTDSATPPASLNLDFTITVNAAPVVDTAPAFVAGAAIEAATFYQDTNITPLTLPRATGGEGAITYALTPPIPGMFFDTVTGVLSGAPTTAAAATTYTYTAGDTDGSAAGTDESSLTISITVLANTIPTFSVLRGPRYIYTVGTVVNETLPAATGGDGTLVYTLSRVAFLPAGLTFNAAATPPTITGTPTTAARRATYRYNVDDSDANEAAGDGSSLSIRITIRGAAATGITMTIRDLAGDPITSLNEGDDPTTFRLHFDTVPALSGFTADQDVAITVSTPVAGQVGYTAAGRSDFIDRDVASESSGQLQLTVTDDDVATADGVVTYTATVSPSGFTATAMITLVDNEISIVTTPAAVTLATGSTADYTVQLDQEPPGSVTVSVVSVGDAIATVSRNTRVFTAANWNAPASVTVTGMRGGSTTISHSATAAGGFGYQSTDVMVTVTPVAVNFPAGTLVLDQTFQMGTAVDLTLPTATGATTYRLSSHADQSLPAGLTFDGATRVLSGIPTAAQVAEGYVYSARNPDNLDNLNFDITVEATGTPTTPPGSQTLTLNPTAVTESATPTDITATVTLTGGAYTVARSFSIGSSSGTATEGTDYTALSNVVLTIPANLASGTVTFPFTAADDMTVEGGGESLNIRSTLLIVAGTDPDTSLAVANAIISISDPVAADTAPAFAADATVSAQTFTVGTAVDLTLPEATGGEDGIVYTLSTALPAGLTFNSGTRVLDGTPTAVATAATYFYRAADGDGNNMPSDSVLLTFTITVSADTAPAFAGNAAIEAQTYAALTAIMPLTLPTATGGNGDITYTLTPAIPGLTLDAATGVLTGMPTTEATATTYTYTAADGDGNTAAGDEVSLTFSLTVTEAIPTGVVMSVNPTMVMESATPTAVMLTATVTGGTFNVERVVRWRMSDGTASQFSDYTRIGNTDLTIPANMVSGTATFMFTAHVDSVAEPDGETVRIEGGVLNLARNGTDSSLSFTPAILTINDGTDTGTAPTSQTVTINPTAVTESADPTDITATVTLNGGVFSVARAFRIEARGGTASAVGVDYSSIDNTILTIPANTASDSVTFEFMAVVDTLADSGETVMIRSTLLDISENAADPTVPFVSATLTINDAPAPGTDTTPAFSTTVSAQVFAVGTAVNLTLPAATDGNGVITYTLAPTALAAGLTFNPAANPPTITGTPNTQASPTTYTYTATDEDGDDASLAFAISVGAAPVDATPAFANGARIPTQDFTVDVRIASLSLPQATGGDAPLSYTLTPPLSAGLTFDGTARTITGTPTTAATLVTYRYTATDMDGDTATLTFRVTVVASTGPAGPSFGSATVGDQAYFVSTAITSLTLPVATGGTGTITYTLTPAIPGLTFVAATRILSGTPTTAATERTFTYTATDTANATDTLMFSITIDAADTVPAFVTMTVPAQIYTANMPITPLTLPAATGGNGASTYALTPALPTGLAFDAAARTISGTPTAVAGAQTFTYTAGDTDGSAAGTDEVSLMFSITVNRALPTGVTLSVNPPAVTESDDPTTITVTATLIGGSYSTAQTITVMSANGTATNADYTTVPGTPLTILAEMTSGTVDIMLTANVDTMAEAGGETVLITGTAASGIPVTDATITINDYALTVNAGDDQTVASSGTITLNSVITGSDSFTAAWALSDSTAVRTALEAAGLDMTEAQAEVTRLTTALAGITTQEGTLTAPAVSLGLTDPVALAFTLTVTDTAPPAGQTVAATGMDEVIITVEAASGVTAAQARDMVRNEVILPEVARSLVNSTSSSITRRVGQAVGSIPTVGSFNFAGQSMDGQHNLATALRTQGEAMNADSRDIKEMLAGSDFVLPLNATGGAGASSMAFWGSGEFRDFSGDSDDLEWDGDLTGFQLGLDARLKNNLLVGVAVSSLSTAMDYEDDRATTVDGHLGQGDYELDMTSAHPYIGWRADELDFWATVGYGTGDLEISEQGEMTRSGDVNLLTVGGGGSGMLWQDDITKMRLKGEVSQTTLEVEDGTDFAEQEVDATSIRVAVEATRSRRLAGGGIFEPSVEVAARYDGGDGETGGGAEVGGALRYRNPATGLTADGRIRALIGQGGSYEEWGISGTIRVAPGTDGQGLSFSLSPGYGNSGSGIQELWRHGLTADETTTDDYAMKLDARVGYGYGFTLNQHHGVLTPYSEMTRGTTDSYRMGLNWAAGTRFDLTLLGERRVSSTDPAEHAVLLKGEVRF